MPKPTHVFDDSGINAYAIDQSDHAWIFDEGCFFLGGNYPIFQLSTVTNDKITINAQVLSTSSAAAGIFLQGSNSKLIVSDVGMVSGATGILTSGANLTIENDGTVTAQAYTGRAIDVEGTNGQIVNNGNLAGNTAIYMNSDDGIVNNNGHIYGNYTGLHLLGTNLSATLGKDSVVTAGKEAIWVECVTGEKSTVTNNGLIAATYADAFVGGNGDDTFINHGTVRGAIHLGIGNDVFNNLDGKFSGYIEGGQGDDIFIVDSAKAQIYEKTGEGNDLVKSTVSFSLTTSLSAGSEIENLTLLGTKKLHGTGNALNNEITGNAGDNVLDAGAGMDQLKGGKGADTFIFATGHESDSILDFGNGADKIDLSGCADIHSFKDLMSHHVSEDKGNVYIDSGMTDELILQHTSKADLHSTEFIF